MSKFPYEIPFQKDIRFWNMHDCMISNFIRAYLNFMSLKSFMDTKESKLIKVWCKDEKDMAWRDRWTTAELLEASKVFARAKHDVSDVEKGMVASVGEY